MLKRYSSPGKIDRAARTVELSFSSEKPAIQRDANGKKYWEILDHDPANVDLSLLNNRGAFLDEHDSKEHLGVIETASVAAGKGVAVAKLDDHPKAEMRLGQMEKNSRPHISVGYEYTRELQSIELPGGKIGRRFAWRALEVSSVAIPADGTIGVGRSLDEVKAVDLEELQEKRSHIFMDTTTAKADDAAVRNDERKKERNRISEITATADQLIKNHPACEAKVRELVSEAMTKEMTAEDFKVRAYTAALETKPQAKQVRMADLGFDESERNAYSITRAIQNCFERKNPVPDPDTLEGAAHERMSKLDRGQAAFSGFLVPADAPIATRSISRHDRDRLGRAPDMQVNVASQGGYSVATQMVTPIIELLRNRMVTQRLGVRMLSGLTGNVVIPRQTGAGTAYAVSEIQGLTLSNQVIDQVPLIPKRVGATGQYSKQLVIQSSIDVEGFIRDDFLAVIGLKWDSLILNGQGSNSEPLGIMNTPGVGSQSVASVSFQKLVTMWTQVAAANADIGEMGYVTTPTSSGLLQYTAKLLAGATTVAAEPLWVGGGITGTVNGYRALASNQVPNNQVIFGVWSQCIQAIWGGLDVVIDPYTLARNAEVAITINTWGDVAIRHPQCFCVSPDAVS